MPINMRSFLTPNTRLAVARRKILEICEKYDVDLAPKYDDGVAVVLVYSESYKGGESSIIHEQEL